MKKNLNKLKETRDMTEVNLPEFEKEAKGIDKEIQALKDKKKNIFDSMESSKKELLHYNSLIEKGEAQINTVKSALQIAKNINTEFKQALIAPNYAPQIDVDDDYIVPSDT